MITGAFKPAQLKEEIKVLEKKLFINKLTDWYDVPKSHLRVFGGSRALLNAYLYNKKGESNGREGMDYYEGI